MAGLALRLPFSYPMTRESAFRGVLLLAKLPDDASLFTLSTTTRQPGSQGLIHGGSVVGSTWNQGKSRWWELREVGWKQDTPRERNSISKCQRPKTADPAHKRQPGEKPAENSGNKDGSGSGRPETGPLGVTMRGLL